MLFHVTHTPTWESCPYHDPEKAKTIFSAAFTGVEASGAQLVGAWVDAPAHKLFAVVEASDVEQIEAAFAPVIDIGCAETRPVSDALAVLKRRTKGA